MAGAVVFKYRRPSRWAGGIRDEPSEFPGTSVAGGPTIGPRPAMSSADAAAAQMAGNADAGSRRTGRMRAEAVRPGDREARAGWVPPSCERLVTALASEVASGLRPQPMLRFAARQPGVRHRRVRERACDRRQPGGPGRGPWPEPRRVSRVGRQNLELSALTPDARPVDADAFHCHLLARRNLRDRWQRSRACFGTGSASDGMTRRRPGRHSKVDIPVESFGTCRVIARLPGHVPRTTVYHPAWGGAQGPCAEEMPRD